MKKYKQPKSTDDGIHKPIILEGQPFDWSEGAKAAQAVGRKDGSINWKAASMADPGICSCPACGRSHWKEGTKQRCTRCKFEYPIDWREIVRLGRERRTTFWGRKVDTESFYYKLGMKLGASCDRENWIDSMEALDVAVREAIKDNQKNVI